MGEMRNAYRILIVTTEVTTLLGRSRCTCKDNRLNLKEECIPVMGVEDIPHKVFDIIVEYTILYLNLNINDWKWRYKGVRGLYYVAFAFKQELLYQVIKKI
jgi:hypothetical protein